MARKTYLTSGDTEHWPLHAACERENPTLSEGVAIMPTMGAKWKQISPRWPELGSDPRTPHDRSPGRRCRPGSQPPLQQPSGRMSCKVMNPKTMTHLRSKVPNASKCIQMPYCRCKQTAFKRAVLLQLSQPSTESAEHEQSVRRNMSQYVTTCHDMS